MHRRLAAIGDQGNECIELCARSLQRLGYRFRGRPSRPSFRCHALGLVERRRIEPCFPGETGRRELGARREPVDGSPDLVVCQHGHGRRYPHATVTARIGIITLSHPPAATVSFGASFEYALVYPIGFARILVRRLAY